MLSHIPHAKISGMLVEEMARKGVEVILGASRDLRFGPLMMFGLGGTLVEVLKDVTFRLAPMWEVSAEKMVHEIRSFTLLNGFRGARSATSTRSSIACCGSRPWSATIRRSRSWTSTR